MSKSKIVRDTFFITAVEFLMEGLSLIVNIFITRNCGSETIGRISLISSFFMFATIISSGNVFLSTSRFISEEIGRSNGNPGKVFGYGIRSSLTLSIVTATVFFLLSDFISNKLLGTDELSFCIKILACILPVSSVNTCYKGYFTAYRSVFVPSVCGVFEFLVRSALLCFFITRNGVTIYSAFAFSVLGGQVASLVFMGVAYLKKRCSCSLPCSIGFGKYVFSSVPIFLNSLVTSVLSSANDALVPITLKQYGNSTSEAFSQFGIFEAIVIPALFFPSSLLCSLSSILVPELARERGAQNSGRNISLINKALKQTFAFSVFMAVFFFSFGDEIGFLMSGEEFAGKIIAILAPAVPFIYLEIILEGILKGMGKHTFSSVNYLVEYTIRISVLLVTVPVIGFYGIVASYLASNITCNISRIVMILKITGIHFDFPGFVLVPVLSGLMSLEIVGIIENWLRELQEDPLIKTIIFALVMLIIYALLLKLTRPIICNTQKEKKIKAISDT